MASTIPDFAKMTISQLREQLKSRGLPVSGAKNVLVERLTESYLNEEKILNADVSMPKGSLEDVLDVSVNEDDVLGPASKEDRSSTDESPEKAIAEKGPEKVNEIVAKETEKEHQEAVDPKQRRAERFGLPPTEEQKKRMRAERFGLTSGNSGSGDSEEELKRRRAERFGLLKQTSSLGTVPVADKDILRKRAERFGLELKNGEQKQKDNKIGSVDKASAEVLEQRAKRFGISNEKAEVEIKKQKRAERFGLNRS